MDEIILHLPQSLTLIVSNICLHARQQQMARECGNVDCEVKQQLRIKWIEQ